MKTTFTFLLGLLLLSFNNNAQTGAALDFDGVNDNASITHNSNLNVNQFTIESYVKWDGTSAVFAPFICSKGYEVNEIHISKSNNSLRFIPVPGLYADTNANTVMPNTWTHIACVYNPASSLLKIYINGIDMAVTVSGTSPLNTPVTNNTTNFVLGSRHDSSLPFKGVLDEFRFWNRILTQAEIQGRMNCEIPTSGCGLVANFHFNQGSSNSSNTSILTLTDSSGNNNNATLNNFVLDGSSSNFIATGGVASGVNCTYAFPSAPTASATQTICNSGTIATLSATGSNLLWYATANGGTSLATSATLTNNATYYVSQTVNGCESARSAVAVTINTIPSAPTANNTQSFCGGGTVADLTATGTNLLWYATASGGAALATSTNLTDNATYYVSQIINGCESARTAVAVTINPITTPPFLLGLQTVCQGTKLEDLTILSSLPGATLKFYNDLNQPLAPSTILQQGQYYISQVSPQGCESGQLFFEVIIKPRPTAPTATGTQSFCGSGTIANLIATGNDIKWYATATGGTALATSTALVNGTTYYVAQTVNGCESTRTAVAVSNSIPNAPTATATQTVCLNATIINLTATGSNIKWYDVATGGTALPTSTTLVNGTTYYASQTVNGCESTSRTAVSFTTFAPEIVNLAPALFCSNQPTKTISSTITSPPVVNNGFTGALAIENWTRTLNGFTEDTDSAFEFGTYSMNSNFTAGNTATMAITLPYDATLSFSWQVATLNLELNKVHSKLFVNVNGVPTTVAVTENVNYEVGSYTVTIPANQPFSINVQSFADSNIFPNAMFNYTLHNIVLTANPVVSSLGTYQWIASNGGTIVGSNTNSAVNIGTSGTYQLNYTSANGCASSQSTVATVVDATPPIANTTQKFCVPSTIANLLPQGNGIKWYDVAAGGNPLESTTQLLPNTNTYYVANTGCETERTAVTAIVDNSTIEIETASPTFCAGSANTLTAKNYNVTSIVNEFTGFLSESNWAINNPVGSIFNFQQFASNNLIVQTSTGSIGTSSCSITFNKKARLRFRFSSAGTTDVATASVNGQIVAQSSTLGVPNFSTVDVLPGQVLSFNFPFNQIQLSVYRIENLTTTYFDESPLTGTYAWQATNGGTIVGANNAPTITVGSSGTYEVTYTSAADCTKTKSIAIVVNPAPDAPTAPATQSFCGSGTIANLAATGTNLKWYADATGGTTLAISTALVNGTTYYVSQSANGCESERTAVAVTINSIPSAPTASTQIFCSNSNATIANLQVNAVLGATVNWYGSAASLVPLNATDLVTTGTYFVSQTFNGCVSARTPVLAAIEPSPLAPTASTQAFCSAATVASLLANGTDIKWYATASSTTALATTTALNTGTYYATQTLNGCESDKVAVSVQINNGRKYVNDAVSSSGDGSSWATAYKTLQEAIDASCGDEIWVAAGTYKPNSYPATCFQCTSPRDFSFYLKPNIKLYGGFNGTETLLSERNTGANQTILSGDIGTIGSSVDNCHSVIISINDGANTEINGFIIRDGNANVPISRVVEGQSLARTVGGGLLTVSSPIKVNNCVFIDNYAEVGGGMFNSSSLINVANTVFVTNSAIFAGAIFNGVASSGSFENCTIYNNTASALGGGIFNQAGSSATISNCIMAQNFNGSIFNDGSNPVVTNSLIQLGYAAGTNIIDADPLFVNVLNLKGADNKWMTEDDGLNITPCSLAVDAGVSDTNTPIKDITFSDRFDVSDVGTSTFDYGAYENQSNLPSAPTVNPNQTLCSSALVSNLTATGSNIKWYDQPTGGNVLADTTILTAGNYYASQTINSCESVTRAQVVVSLTPAPVAPTASLQNFCTTSTISFTVSDLQANSLANAVVKWYNSPTSSTPLASTTTLATGTYYVSQFLDGCESLRTAVEVSVNPLPEAPTVQPQSFCSNNEPTVADLQATGTLNTTFVWFSSATATTPLSSIQPLQNGLYYVAQQIGDCIGMRSSVQITVITSPSAPVAATQTLCESPSNTIASLIVTSTPNATLNWYDNIEVGTPLQLTTPLVTGTLYVSQTVNGCESSRTAVSVVINPKPMTDMFYEMDQINNNFGSFYAGGNVFQTFKAGKTGTLKRIAVFHGNPLGAFTSNGGSVPMNVYQGQGTSGTLLATALVTVIGGQSGQFFDYNLSNLNVVAGQDYTFELIQTDPIQFNWYFVGPNTYSNGYSSFNPNNDLLFKTFIDISQKTVCGDITFGDVQILNPNNNIVNWFTTATGGLAISNTSTVSAGTYYVSQTTSAGCLSDRKMINLILNSVTDVTTTITSCGSYTWPVTGLTYTSSGNYLFQTPNASGCFDKQRLNLTITAPTIWNGSTWSNGLPNAGVQAIFNGNFTATTNLSACSVLVFGTAVVTIPSGFNLTVTNEVTVSANATLNIENNANLIQINDVANTGNIVVKRNTLINRLDFTYWSSPVAGQNLLNFTPQTLPNRFYTYNEPTKAFVQVASPAATAFDSARGYSLRAPNNFLDAPAAAQAFVGMYTGVPNNGDFTIPVTFTAGQGIGYNLIGNPYPSTVSGIAFLTANTGSMYFWTHSLLNAGVSNYAVYNLSGGTAATAGGPGVMPNGFIQTGQGFMFLTTSSKNVTFTNAMRQANNANQFFRSAATAQNDKIWLNLSNNGGAFSQTMIAYLPNTTTSFDDGYDAPQLNANGNVFSSQIADKNYAIQSRGNFAATDVVKLNINSITAGNYTISTANTEGVFSNAQVFFLKDNLLGITHNIKQSPYNFVATAGETANRFELVYETALSNNSNLFAANSVIVFEQNGMLHISATDDLKNVKIFDVQGRTIFETNAINAKSTVLTNFRPQQQVLLVQITSLDNQVVTKKVVF
jgi:hypothetical protein